MDNGIIDLLEWIDITKYINDYKINRKTLMMINYNIIMMSIKLYNENLMFVDLKLQNIIKSEFKNSTVLTVAHRINTIISSDKVLVLSQGKILEYDSPENLLKIQNGAFIGDEYSGWK